MTGLFLEDYNNLMKKFVFLMIFTCLSFDAFAGYTLKDLEVLTQEDNYDEFFSHALDIRPAERQGVWKEMLSKMADGLGQSILNRSEISKENFLKIEKIYLWPALRTDDVFKGHRQAIGLRYLKQCLKLDQPCWPDYKNFWEIDPKDPELAIKLAELALGREGSPIPTWNFLDVALKSPLSEFYCKKEFVLEAIFGKLEIDYIRLTKEGDLLKKIDETVHPDCLISFNKWLQEKLLKPNRTIDRELSFQILSAQGKTSQEILDFFYTAYLLETPSQGDLFNLAWSRLNELSKNSTRREKVLAIFKNLDPLPDELFASSDENKKRIILSHFKLKFPEYLDYYSQQCLNYYQGKTTFKNGNPTMKCPDLMKLDNAKNLIGNDKVETFFNTTKL